MEKKYHHPHRQRPSKIQRLVADALHVARIQGFEKGLHNLEHPYHQPRIFFDARIWFANKCIEHGISAGPIEREVS